MRGGLTLSVCLPVGEKVVCLDLIFFFFLLIIINVCLRRGQKLELPFVRLR